MLQEFIQVMNQADEIVAHNGDRFDITWLRTRCLFHGIPMVPDYVSIDTLKLARGKFRFNSNRLDYIAQYLGLGGKIHAEYDLWKQIVLNKDAAALRKMVRYCKRDVRLLEQIWERINPYVKAKTSVSRYASQCPECGSERTVINQRRRMASGYLKISFYCKDCGKYHSTAASRFDKDKAASPGGEA
jgi:DNA polymerase III epsilon subunit-like protein